MTVEAALVLGVFLVALFSMLDLALLVLHQNTLIEASRRLSREAMVHGEKSAPERTTWGPATISGTAADNNDCGAALRPELVTFDHALVAYTIEWPDGSNTPDDAVRVTLAFNYTPLVPFVLGTSEIPLLAVSTMRIAH
ncbi:MAG: TadE/TadG family type IV pilus assembly protein [Planctomycetaceae bacterium]